MDTEDRGQSGEPIPTFYSNQLQASSQQFDMVLTFGVVEPSIVGASKDIEQATKPVARVYMSHAHAKTMLPMLAKLLAEYEAAFGTIPAPGFEEMGKS